MIVRVHPAPGRVRSPYARAKRSDPGAVPLTFQTECDVAVQCGNSNRDTTQIMPTTALKRVAENGEVVWNLRALDWPLRSTAKRETVDGVRKAVLEYLDWMGRMSLDRTSSQIRREVSRATRCALDGIRVDGPATSEPYVAGAPYGTGGICGIALRMAALHAAR